MTEKIDSKSIVVLLLLLLLASYLQITSLQDWFFEGNELGILFKSSESLFDIQFKHSMFTHEPPLKNIIFHFWQKITRDPLALRSLGLVSGILHVPVFFLIGLILAGRQAGLIMGLIAATSYELIIQSQLLRMYSLFSLLISICIACFFYYQTKKSKLAIISYFVAAALSMYLHYGSIIVILALNISLLVKFKKRELPSRRWRIWVFGHILLLLIWLIPILILYSAGEQYLPKRGVNIRTFADLYYSLTQVLLYLSFPTNSLFPWVFPVFCFFGMVVLVIRKQSQLLVFITSIFVINILLAVLGKYPFSGTRHCIFLIPCMAILVGVAVQYAYENFKSVSSFGLTTVLVSAIFLNYSFAFTGVAGVDNLRLLRRKDFPIKISDHQAALAFLKSKSRKNDSILVNHSTYLRLLFDAGNTHWPFGGYLGFKNQMREMLKSGSQILLTKETPPFNSGIDVNSRLYVCWNLSEIAALNSIESCRIEAIRKYNDNGDRGGRLWYLGPITDELEMKKGVAEDVWKSKTAIAFPFS